MNISDFLAKCGIEFLLVNTTNEFLVEYNTLQENSLYKLTGFTGSTATALVTSECIFLFVDGRYHIQADNEVDHNCVKVVKINSGKDLLPEILKVLPQNSTLGMFSKKNSLKSVNNYAKYYNIKLIDVDPFESETKNILGQNVIVDCGFSTDEKIHQLAHALDLGEDDVLYITDLDDVSYLFNLRNYSIPYSAKIRAKALLFKDKAVLYTPDKFSELEDIFNTANLNVLIDPSTINAYDTYLLEHSGCNIIDLDKNPIQYMRAYKTDFELNLYKKAFSATDKALSATRDYIYNNDNISEYDIEQVLREEFKKQGALGLSFKPIVAKDKNSALAHYSKSSKDEIVTDGSLVLIDCGAYFDGGLATDITRVFVKGNPTKLQKKIYTLVLKAFLRGFFFDSMSSFSGYDIDNYIRKFFAGIDTEGFIFNHGLGHGIGINVHENPPSLSNGEIAKEIIQDGMCFTIEPGLYKENEFGVRLENSCYFKDGKINSFVNMNFEQKLIDYTMLDEKEKIWLDHFEVK